jgi:hypothetical protein
MSTVLTDPERGNVHELDSGHSRCAARMVTASIICNMDTQNLLSEIDLVAATTGFSAIAAEHKSSSRTCRLGMQVVFVGSIDQVVVCANFKVALSRCP